MLIRLGKFEINLSAGFDKLKKGLSDTLGGNFYWNESSSTNSSINEASALRISTVSTCLKVLGESIATLPINVHQRIGNKNNIVSQNKAHYLIHNSPNPNMTAFTFWFSMVVSAAGWGEAYALITRNIYEEPERLDILQPWQVTTHRLTTGEVYYKYLGQMIDPINMLVIKPFTIDGIKGISLVRYNSETMNFALKQYEYRGKVFSEKPPGYLSSDNAIKEDQIKAISENWKGQINRGTPVLYNGLKYYPLSFSPGDLQLLDAAKATKQDIYGLFRIPPTLAQDYERATFSNAEQQSLVFVQYTLLPIITNIEQECNIKLFPYSNRTASAPFFVKFSVNSLLRGDYKTRTEGYRTLFSVGAFSQNDIREYEDENPIDGGDRYYVPMNMIPCDRVDDYVDKISSAGSNTQPSQKKIDTREVLLDELIKKTALNGNGKH